MADVSHSPERRASDDDVSMLLNDQLCFALYAATHGIQRLYRPLLDDLGLTYPQYLVLLVLWENDGLTVSQVGDRLALNSATLTPLLKRMEDAGLVSRNRSKDDERRVEIALRPKGRRLKSTVQLVTNRVTCAAEEAAVDPARLLSDLRHLNEHLAEPA